VTTIDASNVLYAYNALYGGALSKAPLSSETFGRIGVENILNQSPVIPQGPFDTTGSNLVGTLNNLAPLIDAIETNSTLATTGGPVGYMIDAYYTRQTSAATEKELLGSILNISG